MNGVVAMPFSDAYNAAKFAVEGLMEGLAPVLREFGCTSRSSNRGRYALRSSPTSVATSATSARTTPMGTHQSIQRPNGCARLRWPVRRIGRGRDLPGRRRSLTCAAVPVVRASTVNRCTKAGRHHRKEHPGRDPDNASPRMRQPRESTPGHCPAGSRTTTRDVRPSRLRQDAIVARRPPVRSRSPSTTPSSASRRRRRLPTDQRSRPAIRLTDPPTITTPNTYESIECISTVRRIRRSRSDVSETW